MSRANVEPLGRPLNSTSIAVTGASQSIVLGAESKRISIASVGGACRYELATAATLTASATTSHYIGESERLDLAVPAGTCRLAVILAPGSTATSVEVTELS